MDAADNARATSSLMWTTTRLGVLFACWSQRSEDAAAAVWLKRSSRHLLEHAQRFSEIRPESLLLPGSSAHGEPCLPPDDRCEDGLARLAYAVNEAQQPAAAVARGLMARFETEGAELRGRCQPHADGALARALDFLTVDLETAQADCPATASFGPASPSSPEFDFRLVAPVG